MPSFSSGAPNMKRVIVHIDRLVLHGFRYDDRYAFSEGLSEELARLYAEPDATRHLTSRGNLSRLKLGTMHVEPEVKPAGIGAQTARSIARELKS